MIWTLLLAHFLGDFPLQPDWMARRKANFSILLLHVSVHFVLMVFLVGQSRNLIWPYLLVLTLVHLAQDRLKIILTDLWPGGMVLLYFVDQILHFLAIWVFVSWVNANGYNFPIAWNPTWAVIAIAYLIVTYILFISERVVYHRNSEYLKIIDETKIARMLARSSFISLFFLVRVWALPNLAVLLSWPYPASEYRYRAILFDLCISLIVILFLVLTIGLG